MDDWKLPWEGGCRCGRIRLEITAPPMLTGICHCTGCQRMSGSAFSLTITVPEQGFLVTRGEAVIGGIHGDQAHHHHCDHCKSWVFTTVEPSMGFVNVRATMLDDARWFVPYVESYKSEALPWALTGAARSFEEFPAMEDYGALVAEFADAGVRPG